MLDQLIGRPSIAYKRIRTLSILYLLSTLIKSNGNSTPFTIFKWINRKALGKPAWMVVVYTLMAVYMWQNIQLLLFLNPPDPLTRMYTRSFFRATWILTAMDAGFFTAMNIPFKPARDICSVIFSLFYLFFPDSAHTLVKKYPPSINVMRTSWEKSSNPILRAVTYFDRGYLAIRRNISIQRPTPASPSSFSSPSPLPLVKARLYHAGSKKDLAKQEKLIFDIAGGGFVCMSPIHHDDYLSQLSRVCKCPLLSINYGKSPEYAYPWALEECFDAYRTVIESKGAAIGMNLEGKRGLQVIVMGDSAGANLATGLIMKIIEWHHSPVLNLPVSLILIYPCLSFEMACWMPTEHMEMLEQDTTHSGVLRVVKSKTDIRLTEPLKPRDAPRTLDVESGVVDDSPSWYKKYTGVVSSETDTSSSSAVIHSNLSMTSRMTFFNDRILGPEMMRSMALMYLAKSPLKPDVTKDFYLSPILTPEIVLAQFPKTFIMCGEKDPLVDDTVVIAARLRQAKRKAHMEWKRLKDIDEIKSPTHQFALDPEAQIKVKLLPGMSHGFLQFQTVFPEGKKAVKVIGQWINQAFREAGRVDIGASGGDLGMDDRVTSLVLGGLMNEIEENGVLMRRRNSLASKLNF